MKGIVKFFEGIVDLLKSIIDSILEFFGMAMDAVTYITSLSQYLPAFLATFLVSLLAVYVIKLIVGR